MKKIISIVGPTSSGKSSLAVTLAQEFHGQVISADSRQIFRYLDIVSGKVSSDEMQGVPHHLLSIIEPSEHFSVAEFQSLAYQKIDEIHVINELPILVGGTGLYHSAVVDGYSFSQVKPSDELRSELEELSVKELRIRLESVSPNMQLSHSEAFNRHRLIRRIEKASSGESSESKNNPLYENLTLGLQIDRSDLEARISERVQSRLDAGAIEEVEGLRDMLVDSVGEDQVETYMKQIGLSYYVIWRFLQDDYDFLKMKEKFIRSEMQYAKRQLTWWKRQQNIIWIDYSRPFEESRETVSKFLNNESIFS